MSFEISHSFQLRWERTFWEDNGEDLTNVYEDTIGAIIIVNTPFRERLTSESDEFNGREG